MENKARKMFAAVVVIMLCAVAIVGVGYAYTASTRNDGNNVSSEYATLTQTGLGAYNFANDVRIYFDTVNTASNTEYKLTGLTQTVDDYTAVQLGPSFTITPTMPQVATGNLTFDVGIADGTISAGNGWFVVIKSTSDSLIGYAVYVGADWTSTCAFKQNGDVYHSATIEVYYAYDPDDVPTVAPAAQPFDDAKVIFTATSTGDNAIVLSAQSVVLPSGTAVIYATLNGAPTGDIAWSSSDNTKVTVEGSETGKVKATLTYVADGNVTITASVTIGGNVYTATCSVTNE